ncbi:TIGR00730 family Rossman fold protein [Nocardioides panacisoli]|nr:TIGR00730 family Rossman fold protein [Nocardioides panacisoli]
MTRLAVFLGSRDGHDPAHVTLANDVGRALAERDIELVYGAGGGGLMGHLSDAVLAHGGRVYGVLPRFMVDREWGRPAGDRIESVVVESMHERKALMAARADAFLTLPGGLGTLEEFFELWTHQTLAVHEKPSGLLNPGGFWDPLLATLDRIVEAGFADRRTVDELVVAPELEDVLAGLEARRGQRA